ncbi:MAG: phosphotransferase, partial [Rhodospirillaceae bacterium]|nr:phosphotransferase [Rhodospirillaceae bacterium]
RLLKFSNAAEDPGVTNFQTTAFQYVAEHDPGFPVSRVIQTTTGAVEITVEDAQGTPHVVRLFSWLEGLALSDFDPAERPDNAHEMGGWLARLALTLKNFSHPSDDYILLYDPKHVLHLEPFLEYVTDQALHDLLKVPLEHARNQLVPALNALPMQVVFNDMSPRNYIVDPADLAQVTGFIDFGDMVRTPRIADIAVGCMYWINDSRQPLDNVCSFLSGYHQRSNLKEAELSLLIDLMMTRSTIQALIYHWRADMFPANRAYIMQNMPQARRSLEMLSAIGKGDALDLFKHACR